jgi:hypothetical protein
MYRVGELPWSRVKKEEGKMKKAEKFIKKELSDLDIPENCDAYIAVYESAIVASTIMTKKELVEYIEGFLESLPNSFFHMHKGENLSIKNSFENFKKINK